MIKTKVITCLLGMLIHEYMVSPSFFSPFFCAFLFIYELGESITIRRSERSRRSSAVLILVLFHRLTFFNIFVVH